MSSFLRLVRFVARDGQTHYGDAILPSGTTDIAKARQARIIQGDIFGAYRVTDQIVDIRLLLSPLALSDTGTLRCLGLNYSLHAKESNMPEPKYPVLFYKPNTSCAGPCDPIPVSAMAQQHAGLDYECELVVVIGKRGRDISTSDALSHVLGYAVGNDVSHRDWQIKLGGGQWSHGKGFDGWAPYGPGIVSPSLIPDPQKLRIWTRVNGAMRQDETTADMIFDVRKAIALLSRGVTLMPGDLIWTGTPSGVGMGQKPEPIWLKDGDIVEVGLENVGTCTNRVEFARSQAKL